MAEPSYTNTLDQQPPSYKGLLDQRSSLLDQTSSGQPIDPAAVDKQDLETATFLDEARKGLRRFGYSTIATTQGFVGSLVAPFAPNAGNELIKDGLRTMHDMPRELAPAVENWGDIKDFRSGALKFGSALGEGLPSAALSVGAGIGGRALGAGVGALRGLRGAALETAAARTGFGAGMASMLPMEGGETALDLAKDPQAMANTTPAQRAALVLGRGSVNAALENIVPQALVVPRLLNKAARIQPGLGAGLRNTALIGAEGALGEYGTEAAQELTGQFAQNLATGKSGYDLKKAHEAGLSGAAVGGIIGGGAGVAQSAYSNVAPVADKVSDVVSSGMEKLRNNMPSYDDVFRGVLDTVDNPEEAGAALGRGTLGAMAQAAEAAGVLRKYGAKGVETATDWLDQTALAVSKHIARNIKDPELRERFAERAADLQTMTGPAWRIFTRDLAEKSGSDFMHDTGVAAGLLGRKAVKGAESGLSWVKDAAKGYYDTIVKGAEGMQASTKAPTINERAAALARFYAAAPGLKDATSELTSSPEGKKAFGDFLHYALHDPSYLVSGADEPGATITKARVSSATQAPDPTLGSRASGLATPARNAASSETVAPMIDKARVEQLKKWSDDTGTDLIKVLNAMRTGRNDVLHEELVRSDAARVMKRLGINPRHHDDLMDLVQGVSEFDALSPPAQREMFALVHGSEEKARELFLGLSRAGEDAQAQAEKATGAGELQDQFRNLSPVGMSPARTAARDPEEGSGRQDITYDELGNPMDPAEEVRSPFDLDVFQKIMRDEDFAHKTDVPTIPVRLQPQGEHAGLHLGKLGRKIGVRVGTGKGKTEKWVAPKNEDYSKEGLLRHVNPMSLTALVGSEGYRDRFAEHMTDYEERPGASQDEVAGQRFMNVLSTLLGQGIHIDPEQLGLPPGDPVHVKVSTDLSKLPDNLILRRGHEGKNLLTWADVNGKNQRLMSPTKHRLRLKKLLQANDGNPKGIANWLRNSDEPLDNKISAVAWHRAKAALKEDRKPKAAELDAAVMDYYAELPSIERDQQAERAWRALVSDVRDAYQAGTLTYEEVTTLADYFGGVENSRFPRGEVLKRENLTPEVMATMEAQAEDHTEATKAEVEPIMDKIGHDLDDFDSGAPDAAVSAREMVSNADAIDSGQTAFEQTKFGQGEEGSVRGTILRDFLEHKYSGAQNAQQIRTRAIEAEQRKRGLRAGADLSIPPGAPTPKLGAQARQAEQRERHDLWRAKYEQGPKHEYEVGDIFIDPTDHKKRGRVAEKTTFGDYQFVTVPVGDTGRFQVQETVSGYVIGSNKHTNSVRAEQVATRLLHSFGLAGVDQRIDALLAQRVKQRETPPVKHVATTAPPTARAPNRLVVPTGKVSPAKAEESSPAEPPKNEKPAKPAEAKKAEPAKPAEAKKAEPAKSAERDTSAEATKATERLTQLLEDRRKGLLRDAGTREKFVAAVNEAIDSMIKGLKESYNDIRKDLENMPLGQFLTTARDQIVTALGELSDALKGQSKFDESPGDGSGMSSARKDEVMAQTTSQTEVKFLLKTAKKPGTFSHAELNGVLQSWVRKYIPNAKIKLHIFAKQAGDSKGFIERKVGDNTIYLADEATNPLETLAVLAHEFGHAIEYNHYLTASVQVKDEMNKQYAADMKALREGVDGRPLTKLEMIKRFGSAANAVTDTKGGTKLETLGETSALAKKIAEAGGKFTPDSREAEQVSFKEWFANQFSKMVTKGLDTDLSPELQSFWKRLFKKVQDFFNQVVKQITPNAAYEEWVKGLAATASEQPTEVPGEAPPTPPPKEPPTPPSGPEPEPAKLPEGAQKRFTDIVYSMAGDTKVRVLFNQKLAQGVKGKFETREQMLEGIRNKLRPLNDALKAARIRGDRNAQSDLTDEIRALEAQEKDVLTDVAVQGFIKLATGMEEKAGLAEHETFHAAFKIFFNNEERRILGTAFSRGLAGKRLREIFKDDPVVLARIKDSEEAAAYAFEVWAADPSAFQLGPQVKNLFDKFLDFVRKLFDVLTMEEKALMIMNNLKSGQRHQDLISPVAKKLDKDMAWPDRALKMAKDVGGLVNHGVNILLQPTYERIIDTKNPALIKIAELSYEATGEEGNTGGMIQRGRFEYKRLINQLGKIFKDLTEPQLKEMHNAMIFDTTPSDPLLATRTQALKDWYKQMYTYQTGAGVLLGDAGVEQGYYPLTWDPEKVLKDKKGFIDMLEKKYAKEMLTTKKTANEIYESITSYIDRGEDLVNVMGVNGEPLTESTRARSLHFIKPEDRIPFMAEDPVHTAFRYTKQAVRQAEYVRSYGMEGNKLRALKEEAEEKYGATAEELALINDFIDGVMGNKEIGMSRELKDLYGAMNVYQNYRLLPFSLFSSLVDPIGIAIRSGSAMDAWDTFAYSMKNLFKEWKGEYTRDFWEQLAEDWGTVEHSGTTISAHNQFDGITLRGTTKDLNDKLFKYNLLNGWIRNNTIMATKMAQKFVYRASEGQMGKHSARYLEELGLTKDDVVYDAKQQRLLLRADELEKAGKSAKEAAEIEGRLRNATDKFVRQSLLNPSAAELPNWASNPYLLPIAHLKSFVFAFNMTITNRLVHEYKHENYKPIMLAAAYVPSMIAADFVKDMIAGFGEEPPYKKDWGLYDYFRNGVDRSGLTGTGQFLSNASEDVMRGGDGYESWAGPAAQQMKKGVKAFVSGDDSAIKNWIIDAMPLKAVYKQHLTSGAANPA